MACSCFGYCYRLAHQPHIAEYRTVKEVHDTYKTMYEDQQKL